MQKWVDKKKKKINVIHWLNTNVKPKCTYSDWFQSITATEEHLEILIEQNITQTVDALINTNFNPTTGQKDYPIYCFVQKVNIFYMHDDIKSEWRQMNSDELVLLSKKVHSRILNALCEWHKKNIDKINQSDKMAILYNKTLIKLMSVNFTQDSAYLSKMKASLHNCLKTDLTNIIEYEFDF
jgi:hypothetical protein